MSFITPPSGPIICKDCTSHWDSPGSDSEIDGVELCEKHAAIHRYCGFGWMVVADPKVPDDTVLFLNRDGSEAGRIVGLEVDESG